MMHDIATGERMIENITFDSVTSQYIPKKDSSIYFYKQLDFKKLMNIELGNSWASNIYNTYKAWDISKGNVDVAIIDQGFHPDAPFLKNNIVEAKVFGDVEWNGNFHGTSMAKALLSIAPEAKLHLLLAELSVDGQVIVDHVVDAIDYCIQENIPVISTSLSGQFQNNEKLINKIEEARDKGITIVWFHYPNNEPGIIRSTFTYFRDETYAQSEFMTGFTLSAFDRFIEDDMFYPQEISAGLSYTAPIGAGLVALIKEVHPDITPEEIKELLIDYSSINNNKQRPAIPDMYEILKKLQND